MAGLKQQGGRRARVGWAGVMRKHHLQELAQEPLLLPGQLLLGQQPLLEQQQLLLIRQGHLGLFPFLRHGRLRAGPGRGSGARRGQR